MPRPGSTSPAPSGGVPPASELRLMLALALPVAAVQVGMMLLGVVDTMMVGHYSEQALAAVALGNVYFYVVTVFGMGALMALDPVVAQAVGAGETGSVARSVQRGMILALGLTVPASLLLLPGEPLLVLLRQPPEVIPVAAGYARVSIAGIFPFYAFIVLRQSLQALGRVAPIVWTMILTNIFNAVLNWLLVFGKLGFPELGPVGSAWATVISRWLMVAGLLAVAWPELRTCLLPPQKEAWRPRPLGRMLRLGTPIGFHHQLEYSAFAAIGLLMGWLGAREMAAHQVALHLAALTFMVPMGISGAAAVRVGYAVGRADPDGAARAAWTAFGCGIAFMSAAALTFLSLPEALARLFTDEEPVWRMAALLIPIAGFFQVFDGLQVVGAGILRGLGDTRSPVVVAVLGFWLVGFPVSVLLGFRTGLGPAGLWWGFVAGLGTVGLTLVALVRMRLGRELRRVVIEDEGG